MMRLVILLMLFNINYSFSQNNKIVLSSRFFHPKDKSDTLSTMSVINKFHVERLDWMYNDNPSQLNQLIDANVKFSLAMNPQLPDSLSYTTVSTRMLDIKGKPYIAPWMKNWKMKNPYWGCVNNPVFQTIFLKRAKEIVNLGAYGIVVDDARFNNHALDWGGGCFCRYCLNNFKKYLVINKDKLTNHFEYRDFKPEELLSSSRYKNLYRNFQTESVIKFLKQWKSKVDIFAERPIEFITNNYGGVWSPIYKVFDVGIAELSSTKTKFKQVDEIMYNAKKLDKKQIFSYASEDEIENASFYLYCYFKGYEALIPWDSNINNLNLKAPTRFYIKHDIMTPILNILSKNRSKLEGSIEINPSSLGIVSTSNAVVITRKLTDGSILILATRELSNGDLPITIFFNKNIVPKSLLPTNLFGFKMEETKNQIKFSGKLLVLKYN